jgi:hypothetical protein
MAAFVSGGAASEKAFLSRKGMTSAGEDMRDDIQVFIQLHCLFAAFHSSFSHLSAPIGTFFFFKKNLHIFGTKVDDIGPSGNAAP